MRNLRRFSTVLLAAVMLLSLSLPAFAAWYDEAAAYVTENGLMDLVDGEFAPNETAPRGAVVTALYRAAGSPRVSGGASFPDVSGEELTAAATWVAGEGIISGYDNGNFGPNDPVTREQLVTMLWRGEGSPAQTRAVFVDTDSVSAYAAMAVTWAQDTGVVNGVGGNRFDPKGTVTRAQLAQVLMNYLTREPAESPSYEPPELPAYADGALSIAKQGCSPPAAPSPRRWRGNITLP